MKKKDWNLPNEGYDDPNYNLTDDELFERGKQIHDQKIIQAGGCIKKLKSSEEYCIEGIHGEFPTGKVEHSEVKEIGNTYIKKKHTTFRVGDFVISANQPIEGFCHLCGQPVVVKRLFVCGVCNHGFCGDHVYVCNASETTIVRCEVCLKRGQRIFFMSIAIGLGMLVLLILSLIRGLS